MKKISILSLHLGYGGIEKSVVGLANILCSRYEVEIAVSYKLYDNSAFQLDKRVKVIYLNDSKIKPNHETLRLAFKNKNIFKIFKEVSYAFKVLKFRKKTMVNYISNCTSDIVISTRDIFNYWLSDYGREEIFKIGWEHNHYHDNYKYAENIVRSARKLDCLVLVSNDLEKFYNERLKNSNCFTKFIPNSIDEIPSKCASLNKKSMVCVGRLSKEKGYIDLLKVFKKVLSDYPDWKLNIIGDGPERENIYNYIEKNNLTDNVILHGFQGKEYINRELHNCSIYLMTSYTESFGIVLIEAMSHGVPCIAFDSAEGAREIINSGENGYLIKNRNIDAMVMKIESLIINNSERKKLGKAARESVKKYSSDVVGEAWFDLIEESD